MLPRVAQRFAALLVVVGCGRSGLELDDAAGAGDLPGVGGASPVGGGGGGKVTGSGGLPACDPVFASNEPTGEAVSTLEPVTVGYACGSEGMIDASAFKLVLESPLGQVYGDLTWSQEQRQLVLTPAAPFALATTYTATAGIPGAELTWSFRTTDGEWQPEEIVGTGGDVALAVSSDGQGIVGMNTGAELRVRRFTLEGGLAEADEVLSEGSVIPRSVRVGVAKGGEALAVWGESALETSVRARRGPVDGPFRAPVTVGVAGDSRLVEDFSVAGDGTGVLLTSRRRSSLVSGALDASAVGPDGFGVPMSLSDPMPLDTVRAVARSRGRSWAVWSSWELTGRVLGRFMDPSPGPGPPTVVRAPAARAGFAAMGVDGSAFMIWEEGSPLDSVKAARFTPEGDREEPFVLDTGPPGSPTSGIYARIAVDDLGRGLALWVNQEETDAGTLESIRAQRFDFTWAPGAAPLSTITVGEWAVISPMGLALDPQGNGFAAFGHRAPARAVVARFLESTSWESPIEVAESATAPLVAVDASGRAALAWASGGKVFLRRFIELTAPRPRH